MEEKRRREATKEAGAANGVWRHFLQVEREKRDCVEVVVVVVVVEEASRRTVRDGAEMEGRGIVLVLGVFFERGGFWREC